MLLKVVERQLGFTRSSETVDNKQPVLSASGFAAQLILDQYLVVIAWDKVSS